MSNADYSLTGNGSFCTVATLADNIAPLTNTFTLTNLKSVGPGDRFVGMAVLIDDEIVRLDGIGTNTISVSRGCADTVPAEHAAGADVWFFETAASSNNVEYVASGDIAVKILPATTSATMPIEYSPPIALEFNSRFIRPYPPADFKVDGSPWYTEGITLNDLNTALSFTWVHRNRVVQQDVLIGHSESSVSPEAGTTYTARIYLASDDSLLRTVTGITGTSWNYTATMADDDIALIPPVLEYRVYSPQINAYSDWFIDGADAVQDLLASQPPNPGSSCILDGNTVAQPNSTSWTIEPHPTNAGWLAVYGQRLERIFGANACQLMPREKYFDIYPPESRPLTAPTSVNLYIDFCSVRDGYESLQKYRTFITVI